MSSNTSIVEHLEILKPKHGSTNSYFQKSVIIFNLKILSSNRNLLEFIDNLAVNLLQNVCNN